MRIVTIAALMLACLSCHAQWLTDFDKAQSMAKNKKQLIILNFSGSDWCGPCIRLKEEIFAQPAFRQLADTSFILVNADFPRNKKNQLPKNLQEQNDGLAEKYNSAGKFPFTALITAGGQLLKTWEGFPKTGSQPFIDELKKLRDGYKNP